MLSKKMAFSLMSLITIIALAFTVAPAMAANDFDAKLSVVRVSAMSDHNAEYGKDIVVTLAFGAIVDGTKATLTIYVEDKFGAQTSVTAPDITAKDINSVMAGDQNDGKTFTFTIPAASTDANDKKVHLLVAAGVKEIVPVGSAKSSKEGKLTIDLVGSDAAGKLLVTNMRLAPGVLVPAGGYTGESFDVIITLSEKPKEFKAANLDVAEATAADPVALPPVSEASASDIQTRFAQAGVGEPPRLRKNFDESGATFTDLPNDSSAVTDAMRKERTDGGGIHRAINEAKILTGTAYMYQSVNVTTGAETEIEFATGGENTVALKVNSTDDTGITTPTTPATTLAANATLPTSQVSGFTQVTFLAGTKRDIAKPTRPVSSDFNTNADYVSAVSLYLAELELWATYQTALNQYNAYDEAVKAEKAKDQDARDEYYAETFGTPIQRGSGRDMMLHPYLVKITPKYTNADKKPVVIKVKAWENESLPTSRKYEPPTTADEYRDGVDRLTIKIGKADLSAKTAGIEVKLLKDGIIPEDGYLVVAKDTGGSAVRSPGDAKKSPAATARQPFGLTYNLVSGGLPNLESFLLNGGTIDLVAPDAGLVISEIMWGTDASLSDSFNSQYIEIRNTSGAEIKMGDGTHKLMFYGVGAAPDMSVAANNIQDRVSTQGSYETWSLANRGQNGRTGVGEAPGDVVAITPTQALQSMQRIPDATSATGLAADGTDPDSWGASEPPGLNFDPNKEGVRIGSPGRAPFTYPTAPTPKPTPKPTPVAPVAGATDIMITEIMVDTGDGRLPQWIELTNVSEKEVSLEGWALLISNAAADADVEGSSLEIDLSDYTLGVRATPNARGNNGQSLLLVGGNARTSGNLAGNDRVVNITSTLGAQGRYTFLSPMGFMIKLLPPQATGVVKYGDTVGNLGANPAWDLPTSEKGRSSLIRYEMDDAGMAMNGTAADGWRLASKTSLVDGPATWIGSDEDAGTPGYDAGGPLPVELSHFRPARDKATGAVVITWATQSELNNAGFFIKRSNQRDGQFQVINATMIAGAGTTSEKQTYTYTDTTAQPNVVYYYQIEDVSLDGNRQTLTRGIRLKGHIGAAGKLTSLWGELKSSNE